MAVAAIKFIYVFPKVLKGISNLTRQEAEEMVLRDGIKSNWWRKNTLSLTLKYSAN
jgi:hypothetical protein